MAENKIDISEIKTSAFWQETSLWLQDFFLDSTTQIQIILVAISIVIGFLLSAVIKINLFKNTIELQPNNPVRFVAESAQRVLLPLLSLIIMFLGSRIMASGFMGNLDISIVTEIMKVMLAWIVIRLTLQFIKNQLLRNIIAIIIWIVLALSIFGILDQTTQTLDAIGFNIGTFRLSALAVIKGILSISLLLYAAALGSKFFEGRIYKSTNMTRSSQVLIAKVIRITLITIALLIGVTSAGLDLSLFAVLGGAIGLGIGFGLQKGVSNLFSGMLLLMDKSIKPGDVIELPEIGTYGTVNNMAARYTEIVTRDNKSFLIPNEDFITQRVVNWSHGNSLIRVHLAFGVHYKSDPHLVTKIAIEAAKNTERVVEHPSPVCWIVEFGDSSINFDLRFWIRDAEKGVANVRGQVFLSLWDAFKENGIEIPYPHREVYIHKVQNEPQSENEL